MGLHHNGVGLEGREGKGLSWKPTETGFDLSAVMVSIILARREFLRDECSHCSNQSKKKGEEHWPT